MDDTPLVARLLATRDDLRFLEALDHHATPPADRLTTFLLGAYLYGGNDGAWKVLETGDFFASWEAAIPWARAIGASRMADWLEAVARRFPGGHLPATEEAMRALLADDSRDEAMREVDDDHQGALDEMVRALRAFVAAHGDDPVAALARVARGEPVKPPPPLEPPPPPPRPAPAPVKHAGFDALFAAAHALTVDDWTRLVQEVHADRRRYDAAASTIAQWYRPAITAEEAAGGPLGAAKRRRWDRLTQPLVQQVTMWLPLARVERGGRIRLQPRAWQLVSAAQRAILTHAAFGDDIAEDVATVLHPFGDEVTWATLGDR